jgi:hypothetical protein
MQAGAGDDRPKNGDLLGISLASCYCWQATGHEALDLATESGDR